MRGVTHIHKTFQPRDGAVPNIMVISRYKRLQPKKSKRDVELSVCKLFE